MTVLEEVIMFTFQQCVYYLTKVSINERPLGLPFDLNICIFLWLSTIFSIYSFLTCNVYFTLYMFLIALKGCKICETGHNLVNSILCFQSVSQSKVITRQWRHRDWPQLLVSETTCPLLPKESKTNTLTVYFLKAQVNGKSLPLSDEREMFWNIYFLAEFVCSCT